MTMMPKAVRIDFYAIDDTLIVENKDQDAELIITPIDKFEGAEHFFKGTKKEFKKMKWVMNTIRLDEYGGEMQDSASDPKFFERLHIFDILEMMRTIS